MAYDLHCQSCPYFQQRHLQGALKTSRNSPPVELESHGSSTLLVFQAPGDREWVAGKPIQPTIKPGGSAGVRIRNSWQRVGKSRDDFDIINAVQCFPGKDGYRDLAPRSEAIFACAMRLNVILEQRGYHKIIAFGNVAFKTVGSLISANGIEPRLLHAAHPNGGVLNSTLDYLW